MTTQGWMQIAVFAVVLLVLAKPLGDYVARVFERRANASQRVLGALERSIHRVCRIDASEDMSWRGYAHALLAFHAVGFVVLYAMQRLQGFLPLNGLGFGAVSPDSAFNTAISFVTNTNWQGYGGESTMSIATQMLGLAVQNFVSAASGIAVMAALARGFARGSAAGIGNFWSDLVKATLYVLLPLSIVLSLALVSQGVVQTFEPSAQAVPLDASAQQEQVIPLGPVASQVAIKQLGTNGGGYYNANSAHPLENPTPLSNLLQTLAILLLPAAMCFTFGRLAQRKRDGAALLVAMCVMFAPAVWATYAAESATTPAAIAAGADPASGNLEGKEARFGVAPSALWAVATTAASNGSVNAMHDSFTPLGGLVPMVTMQLGEVVFGGVGCGLYGLVLFALVAVFVAGLMIGRTPEYLGKKIEVFEMKMASIAILAPCVAVLVGTALAVAVPAGRAGLQDGGPHGFSEALYAFSSAANNNGSAFAGLSANTPLYNTALGLAMLVGRFLVAIPVLAIAGSLTAKRASPVTTGTLPTHGPLFVVLLVGTVVLVGALTFLPALALGPIAEHLAMLAGS